MEKTRRLAIDADLKQLLVKKVVDYFHPKSQVIAISLCGSRGKLTFSEGSDYDIKVILKHSIESYILNKHDKHREIKIDPLFNDKPVHIEGKAIDINYAFNMCSTTNSFISEFLRGCHLYADPQYDLMKALNQSYLDSYKLSVSLMQCSGLLTSELKGVAIDKKKNLYCDKTNAKLLCEIYYWIMSLIALLKFPDKWFELYDFESLHEFLSNSLTSEDYLSFLDSSKKVYEARIQDKNLIIDFTPELQARVTSIQSECIERLEKLRSDSHPKEDKVHTHADNFILSVIKNKPISF